MKKLLFSLIILTMQAYASENSSSQKMALSFVNPEKMVQSFHERIQAIDQKLKTPLKNSESDVLQLQDQLGDLLRCQAY